MATRTETAWAAGLFEGEGCLYLEPQSQRRPNARTARLSLVSTDEDAVQRFHSIVGVGTVNVQRHNERQGHKRQWRWQAGAKRDVEDVLRKFLPWLTQRRLTKAEELLAAIHAPRPSRAQMARKQAQQRRRVAGRFAPAEDVPDA